MKDNRRILIVSAFFISHSSCILFTMEIKSLEPWQFMLEETTGNDINALCACSNEKKEQFFKLLHEEGGPKCTNYRRMTAVGALKQGDNSKEKKGEQPPAQTTAFAEYTNGWARGYSNGIVNIVDSSKAIQEKKTRSSKLDAYEGKPVIALQFSPNGQYLATLACCSLKIWAHPEISVESARKNVPKTVYVQLGAKNAHMQQKAEEASAKKRCCSIL